MDENKPPVLSVLLATVENRAVLFAKLHDELKRQAEGKPVEILVACDAKQISIGKKRQNLLELATGDYVCFVDDDDWVATDYVDSILAALESKPDCVGFEIECTTNGSQHCRANASMRYKSWSDNVDSYRYVRPVYHKTPARRELALKAGFPDLRYGEDRIYSAAIMNHVKTEVWIPRVLYYYRFSTEPFSEKYGIKEQRHIPNYKPYAPQYDYKGRRVF